MKIIGIVHPPIFQSNARTYRTQKGEVMCTMTSIFRADLDWKNFTDYIVEHFENTEKIQFLQFASSDGSEAYTQVLTLLDRFPNQKIEKFFPIQAYDIDKEMVEAANSGLINLTEEDRKNFPIYSKTPFHRCFSNSNRELWIGNDSFHRIIDDFSPEVAETLSLADFVTYRTYSVQDFLRKRVKFRKEDMFDVMLKHNDESNSIVLCRNVLVHLSNKKVEHFIDLLSRKLQKGSLFVIGGCDISATLNGSVLENKGFEMVMKHVFKKV